VNYVDDHEPYRRPDGGRMIRWPRLVNVSLLALFVTALLTGVLAFAVGTEPAARVVVAVHGASGLGALLLVPAKAAIARRGLRRARAPRAALGLGLAVVALLAVGSGLLHAVGGFAPVLGLLPMQLHVGAAVAAAVLLAGHVAVHRRRGLPRRTDPGRRLAVGGAALAAGSVLVWLVAPGRERRATGSHDVGSGDPAAMPVTQWLFDPVPRIPPAQWRLRAGRRELDLAALAALPPTEVRAVLDCTGGWCAEQVWRGVALGALGLPPGRSVDVVSATGYRRRFPAAEAGALLLATHAAGRPLSAGHGAPVRLVAPGRRGFWWVKWVVAVEVVDEPPWWQPPFPVQ
jgi:molybdopterin-dependent oxidoreductase-like protein protein